MPAHAQDAPTEQEAPTDVEAMDTLAPDCVDRNLYSAGFVMLTNQCSTAQDVKVVISMGFDSNCLYLAPGDTRQVDIPLFGSYDKTVTC
ncbi:hypothetical protein [Nocardiopsis oceani]